MHAVSGGSLPRYGPQRTLYFDGTAHKVDKKSDALEWLDREDLCHESRKGAALDGNMLAQCQVLWWSEVAICICP